MMDRKSVWICKAMLVAFIRGTLLCVSLLASLILLQCATAEADDAVSGDASWAVSAAQKPDPATCNKVDGTLVIAVGRAERDEAIRQLGRRSVLALNANTAATLLGPPRLGAGVSASGMVGARIGELAEKKRKQVEEHKGGWSVAEQNRLDQLHSLEKSPTLKQLKPFLVRAIAKNEETGDFSASTCGKTLWVSQFSLGSVDATTLRLPIIVFLSRAPEHVYSDFGMAK